jgi:hypothetical protein
MAGRQGRVRADGDEAKVFDIDIEDAVPGDLAAGDLDCPVALVRQGFVAVMGDPRVVVREVAREVDQARVIEVLVEFQDGGVGTRLELDRARRAFDAHGGILEAVGFHQQGAALDLD